MDKKEADGVTGQVGGKSAGSWMEEAGIAKEGRGEKKKKISVEWAKLKVWKGQREGSYYLSYLTAQLRYLTLPSLGKYLVLPSSVSSKYGGQSSMELIDFFFF